MNHFAPLRVPCTAHRLSPLTPFAPFALAILMVGSGLPVRALAQYGPSPASAPPPVSAQAASACLQAPLPNAASAMPASDAATAIDTAQACVKLGQAAMARNEADQALSFYDKALALGLPDPTRQLQGEAHMLRAQLALQLQRPQEALDALLQATALLKQAYADHASAACLTSLIQATTLADGINRAAEIEHPQSAAIHTAAQQWLQTGLAQNLAWAQYQQALDLLIQNKTPEGDAWLLKAAEQGLSEAEFAMGHRQMANERPSPQEEARALVWFERAFKSGHRNAGVAAVGIWENLMDRATTPALLQAAIDGIRPYARDPSMHNLTDDILSRGTLKQANWQAIEQAMKHPPQLPARPVQIDACTSQQAAADRMPQPSQGWRIVGMRGIGEAYWDLPALAEGRADAKGCVSLSPAQSGVLRTALTEGQTLVLLAQPQAMRLQLRQSERPGGTTKASRITLDLANKF